MLCPVHGTSLKHVVSHGRYESMVCTPRGRRATPHPVTIIHHDEGFHVEIWDRDVWAPDARRQA